MHECVSLTCPPLPIPGLAAGFDKNGEAIQCALDLGFSFTEIGERVGLAPVGCIHVVSIQDCYVYNRSCMAPQQHQLLNRIYLNSLS